MRYRVSKNGGFSLATSTFARDLPTPPGQQLTQLGDEGRHNGAQTRARDEGLAIEGGLKRVLR